MFEPAFPARHLPNSVSCQGNAPRGALGLVRCLTGDPDDRDRLTEPECGANESHGDIQARTQGDKRHRGQGVFALPISTTSVVSLVRPKGHRR